MLHYPYLITWILWHRLLHPPAHPLFWSALQTPTNKQTVLTRGVVPLIGPLVGCGIWMLLIPLELPVPIFVLTAMVTLSSGYVVVWVLRIATIIARERERGTYDQISVSPSGALGTNWAMCVAILHRDDALGWIDPLRKLLSGLLLFILLMVLLTTAFREDAPGLLQFLRFLLDIVLLAAVSYVEHVQAVVLGSLVGMLMPTFSRRQADVRIWGVMVFVMIQAFTLLMTLLAGLILTSWYTDSSSILAILLVFYLLREIFIIASWRLLAYQLNANLEEFNSWIR
jgi:hypothetical protein